MQMLRATYNRSALSSCKWCVHMVRASYHCSCLSIVLNFVVFCLFMLVVVVRLLLLLLLGDSNRGHDAFKQTLGLPTYIDCCWCCWVIQLGFTTHLNEL